MGEEPYLEAGKGIRRLITGTYAVMAAVIIGILMICQGWEYYAKVELPWANWVCLTAGLAGLGVLGGFSRLCSGGRRGEELRRAESGGMSPDRRQKRSRRIRLGVIGVLSLGMALLIYYLSAHYAFTAGWDPAFVYQDACNMAAGYTDDLSFDYFRQYPNNALITMVYSWMIQLGTALELGELEWFNIQTFQAAGYGLVLFLIYVCADKITGGRHPGAALWCWITGILLIGLSPWVAVQYTDNMAMVMVMAELWIWLKAREAGKGWKVFAWTFCFFLTGVILYRIKPQGLIFLIAAVIIGILTECRITRIRERLRKDLLILLASAVGTCAGLWCVQAVFDQSPYDTNSEDRFGMSHYLMMGLNETEMGGYSEGDVSISAGAATRAERSRVNWETVRERIRNMGAAGLIRQGVRKTLTNFGDGTFAWEQEGMFYSYDSYVYRKGNRTLAEWLPTVYISAAFDEMVEESRSEIWRTAVQCIWMGVLALSAFSFVRAGGRMNRTGNGGRTSDGGLFSARDVDGTAVIAMQLALIGLALFELLFEARARHLLAYAPFFVILAGIGGIRVSGWIRAGAAG